MRSIWITSRSSLNGARLRHQIRRDCNEWDLLPACMIRTCDETKAEVVSGYHELTAPDKLPVDPGDGINPGLDSEEAAFFTLLNNHRIANHVSPLVHREQPAVAAEGHSQDMASNGFFSHLGSGGTSPESRMIAQGYVPFHGGENIAGVHQTAQATFTQWKNSPDHNANMLDPDFTETGIGRAYNPNSQYTWYWTNTFGSPV